jgi:uncharacterized membrane protein
MAKKEKIVAVENEKICAVLSYILVGIIWYFADEKMKKSSLAKYHVKQGLVLLMAWILYDIILEVLIWPFIIISIGLLTPILMLLYYIPVVWMILGMINAATGKEQKLPIIGSFADNFKF